MTNVPDWIVRAAREIHELLGNEPDVHPPADWSRCHYAQIIAYHFAETGLVEAAERARNMMGMHGPCENNSCADCTRAYKKLNAALKRATESGGT